MSKRKVVEQAVSIISPDMNKTQSAMEIVKRMVEQQNSRQEILIALVESGITMKSAPTYLYNTQKKLGIQFRREKETKATRAALIMEEEIKNNEHSRKNTIARLMEEAGMIKAYAATYYYMWKKKYLLDEM